MKKMVLLGAVLGVILSLVLSNVASAAECFVVKKPNGAGNFGDVIVDLSAPGPPVVTEPTNPGGQTAGGFVDVYVYVDPDGDGSLPLDYYLIQDDTFALPATPAETGLIDIEPLAPGEVNHLPEGAMHSAGPGKGIDENEPPAGP